MQACLSACRAAFDGSLPGLAQAATSCHDEPACRTDFWLDKAPGTQACVRRPRSKGSGEISGALAFRYARPEFRTFLTDRIIEAFGDPRYESSAEAKAFWPLWRWIAAQFCSDGLRGQSIDALLDIITKATGNHMCPTRHHFWKGLYDKGRVTEAWVALSRPAMDIALNIFSENAEKRGRLRHCKPRRGRKKETCC